ncbi:MAG: hypothetical protein ACRDT2_22890, partial [Natronosporangium sp.]
MSSRLIRSGATLVVPTVPGAAAVAAFLASFAAAPLGWLWLALAGLTLVLIWLAGRPPRLGTGVPARVLLAAGATVLWTHTDQGPL